MNGARRSIPGAGPVVRWGPGFKRSRTCTRWCCPP